jgi:hypothetical protein
MRGGPARGALSGPSGIERGGRPGVTGGGGVTGLGAALGSAFGAVAGGLETGVRADCVAGGGAGAAGVLAGPVRGARSSFGDGAAAGGVSRAGSGSARWKTTVPPPAPSGALFEGGATGFVDSGVIAWGVGVSGISAGPCGSPAFEACGLLMVPSRARRKVLPHFPHRIASPFGPTRASSTR